MASLFRKLGRKLNINKSSVQFHLPHAGTPVFPLVVRLDPALAARRVHVRLHLTFALECEITTTNPISEFASSDKAPWTVKVDLVPPGPRKNRRRVDVAVNITLPFGLGASSASARRVRFREQYRRMWKMGPLPTWTYRIPERSADAEVVLGTVALLGWTPPPTVTRPGGRSDRPVSILRPTVTAYNGRNQDGDYTVFRSTRGGAAFARTCQYFERAGAGMELLFVSVLPPSANQADQQAYAEVTREARELLDLDEYARAPAASRRDTLTVRIGA